MTRRPGWMTWADDLVGWPDDLGRWLDDLPDDLDDLKPYKRRRDSVVGVSCANADQRAVETFAEERSLKQ